MSETMPRLTPSEIAQFLRATTLTLAAELAAATPAVLAWHPAPGEWCVKDVLGHIIEAERRGFAGRIRIILRSDRPTLEGWDPAAVSRARKDCERDVETLLGELIRTREESAKLVAALRPDDLPRSGLHPVVG